MPPGLKPILLPHLFQGTKVPCSLPFLGLRRVLIRSRDVCKEAAEILLRGFFVFLLPFYVLFLLYFYTLFSAVFL